MLFQNAIAALIGLYYCLSVHAAPSQPVDLRKLLTERSNSWANGTVVSFPDSSTFNDATRRWTTHEAPTYFAAVSPGKEADVAKTVRDRTFKKKTVLTLFYRSNLLPPSKSPFSPLVAAMDTPQPWEVFNKAWQLI